MQISMEDKVKRVWEWTVRKVGMAMSSSKLDVVTTLLHLLDKILEYNYCHLRLLITTDLL